MKVLYIIGVVFFGIIGLVMIVGGGSEHGLLALLGLGAGILLQIIWRIVCEFIIIFWKMHELLSEIKKNTTPPPKTVTVDYDSA